MPDATRLIVGAEDVTADLERAIAEDAGVSLRPTTEGEASVYKWSAGDPVQAMTIADSLARQRLRLLAAHKVKKEAVAREVKALELWLAEQLAPMEKQVARLDNLLDLYQTDFHPTERTTQLPNAELVRRKRGKVREWLSEAAALMYQQQHHAQEVSTTIALAKTQLLAHFTVNDVGEYIDNDTGEVVEFVRDVEPDTPESFVVKQEESE